MTNRVYQSSGGGYCGQHRSTWSGGGPCPYCYKEEVLAALNYFTSSTTDELEEAAENLPGDTEVPVSTTQQMQYEGEIARLKERLDSALTMITELIRNNERLLLSTQRMEADLGRVREYVGTRTWNEALGGGDE